MRNAEATKERILDAAKAEFSAFGIAGARVDRIAAKAGCNKNLIYIYFENKERLFATVLQKNLSRVYDEVRFTADDLPEYAARTFDYVMKHPDLMRLMAWFGLEQHIGSSPERSASVDSKAATLAEAQLSGKLGDRFSPSFLIVAIMTMATAWTNANPFGPSLAPESLVDSASLRRDISEVIRLISEARNGSVGDRR
jgi:AcrR family transcriptional regulator